MKRALFVAIMASLCVPQPAFSKQKADTSTYPDKVSRITPSVRITEGQMRPFALRAEGIEKAYANKSIDLAAYDAAKKALEADIAKFRQGRAAKGFPDKIGSQCYTKLELEADYPSLVDESVVSFAKRDFIRRYVSGVNYSYVSVLKADVGKFKDTVPLVARSYRSSNKDGEVITRTISYDSLDFPYFLAGGDSNRAARFTVTADMVDTSSSSMASLGLRGFREALKAVAPSSGLLTTLTKDSSANVATKIDEQAGKLFSTSSAESVSFDVNLNQIDNYRIELFGPRYEVNETSYNQLLGVWTLGFSTPRSSIFIDGDCPSDNDFSTVWTNGRNISATVLAFPLIDNVGQSTTIKSFLLQQAWWSTDILELTTATSGDPKFNVMCRKIRNAIAEIGLNEVDSYLVAHSVARSGMLSGGIASGLQASDACKYDKRDT